MATNSKEYQRQYYLAHKGEKGASYRKRLEKDPDYNRKRYRRYRDKCLEAARQRRSQPGYADYVAPIQRKSLLARYGITHEDYLTMLDKQGGKCVICGTDDLSKYKVKYFDVDHNHATGQVRGLLCRDCNVTTGVVENKWGKIQLIRQYLAEWNAVEFDVKEKQVPVEER